MRRRQMLNSPVARLSNICLRRKMLLESCDRNRTIRASRRIAPILRPKHKTCPHGIFMDILLLLQEKFICPDLLWIVFPVPKLPLRIHCQRPTKVGKSVHQPFLSAFARVFLNCFEQKFARVAFEGSNNLPQIAFGTTDDHGWSLGSRHRFQGLCFLSRIGG